MDSVIVAQDQSVLPSSEHPLESVLISSQEVVVVTTSNPEVVVTGIMGPPGTSGSITQADDIDTLNLADGAMLVYNTSTKKWVATNTLENQILEAGQF